jgi:hypothetical protein
MVDGLDWIEIGKTFVEMSSLILYIDISRILKAGWELSYLNNIFHTQELIDMSEELIAEKPK